MSRRRRDSSFFASLDAPQWTDLALEQQLLHQQQQQHHHLQPQPPPPQQHDDEMTDAWFEQEHPLHERQSYSGFGFGMDGDDGDGDDGDEHDSYDSSGQAGAVDAPEKRSNGSPSRPFSSPRRVAGRASGSSSAGKSPLSSGPRRVVPQALRKSIAASVLVASPTIEAPAAPKRIPAAAVHVTMTRSSAATTATTPLASVREIEASKQDLLKLISKQNAQVHAARQAAAVKNSTAAQKSRTAAPPPPPPPPPAVSKKPIAAASKAKPVVLQSETIRKNQQEEDDIKRLLAQHNANVKQQRKVHPHVTK